MILGTPLYKPHWLYEKDLIFLYQINSSFRCHSDLKFPGRRRVGKGGVALLWHNRIDHKITPLLFEDDTGLQLEVSPLNYVYLFQVYLSCSKHPIASFYDYLDKLSNLLVPTAFSLISPVVNHITRRI